MKQQLIFGFLAGLGLWAILAPQQAFAREDAVPGSPYTSGRGAGMGDAVLPLADDGASGLFYNPAGLAKIRGTSFEPFNLSFYGNSGYLSTLSAGSFYKVSSLSSFQSNLQNNPGAFVGTGASFVPTFYTRGFAVGILLQSQTGAVANPGGTIRYKSLYQLIPAAGYAMSFAGGIVRLGYSFQWINQASGDNTVPSGTSPLGYNQQLSQGSALSHNLGFALTLPYTYLPSLNIVGRNIGTAHFNSTSLYHFTSTSTGAPATDPMTIDSSLSFLSKLGGGSTINWVFEDRDATNQSKVSLMGRLAAGLEYSAQNTFFLRGGWGSGYPAAGIGFRQKKGEFAFSWYSEELGATYHAQRDARYLLSYAIRAF